MQRRQANQLASIRGSHLAIHSGRKQRGESTGASPVKRRRRLRTTHQLLVSQRFGLVVGNLMAPPHFLKSRGSKNRLHYAVRHVAE
ncbi:hypothetical protein Pan181_07790 [Aeoliella mucimassa]|uniref:Uncharacterized protein n=1 Tax=Aeoliella mucimassa TaxID=2527972 RepID=A0A518AIR3_9BACT|nr:hypothetical protein Pan181_07790 [Aeoliella mucimassa]